MEVVEAESEVGEGGGDGGAEDGGVGGRDEVEEDVLGTGGVLEDGEDGGHGASEVCGVECHCHVDGLVGADVVAGDGGAVRGVVELRGFSESLGDTDVL